MRRRSSAGEGARLLAEDGAHDPRHEQPGRVLQPRAPASRTSSRPSARRPRSCASSPAPGAPSRGRASPSCCWRNPDSKAGACSSRSAARMPMSTRSSSPARRAASRAAGSSRAIAPITARATRRWRSQGIQPHRTAGRCRGLRGFCTPRRRTPTAALSSTADAEDAVSLAAAQHRGDDRRSAARTRSPRC